MRLKKFLVVMMSLLMSVMMISCGKSKNDATGNSDNKDGSKGKISIGVMGSIDAVPMVIAQEQGYFKEEGIDVDLQIFKSAKDRDAALTAGALNGVLCDEIAISIYQNQDIDMKITGTTNGSWTLVAGKDSGINSVSDLKGKKIGISENTMIEYLADYIAGVNGMNTSDIEKVAIPAMPARLEALKNNQIDAAILPAPFNDTAIADGGKAIVTIDNKDIQISVIGFLQDLIDNNPEAIKAFYRAYNKAIGYINSNDISTYEDVIINTVGYSEDMKGNIETPDFLINYLPAEQNVQEVIDWSKDKGLLTKDITASDVISNIGIE